MRIKDMKDYLKPIEKLKEYGVKSLSEVDLLAILIKSGTKEKNCIELAREILNDLDNLSDIFNYDYIRFTKYKGIGEVKAIQIVSGIELFIDDAIIEIIKSNIIAIFFTKFTFDIYLQKMFCFKFFKSQV
jgi:DNA repair protein RadC